MERLPHRLTALLICYLLAAPHVMAQRTSASLSGRTIDSESREPLSKATLQLYRINQNDTTFVGGTYSNERGAFSFSSVGQGSYVLKASYLGYKTLERAVNITAAGGRLLGDIVMTVDAVVLQEAVVKFIAAARTRAARM